MCAQRFQQAAAAVILSESESKCGSRATNAASESYNNDKLTIQLQLAAWRCRLICAAIQANRKREAALAARQISRFTE